jgi:hypothetical protein
MATGINLDAVKQLRDSTRIIISSSKQVEAELQATVAAADQTALDNSTAGALASQASLDTAHTDSSGIGKKLVAGVTRLRASIGPASSTGSLQQLDEKAGSDLPDCAKQLSALTQSLTQMLIGIPAGPAQIALQQAVFDFQQASLQEDGANGAQYQEGRVAAALTRAAGKLSSALSEATAVAGDAPGRNVSSFGLAASHDVQNAAGFLADASRVAKGAAYHQQTVTSYASQGLNELNETIHRAPRATLTKPLSTGLRAWERITSTFIAYMHPL